MQREFITFEVAGQIFGLDIMAIREIRAWSPIVTLPGVPDHVAGVVNLRGTILPVVDLSVRLGWAATETSPRHAIIVTHFQGQAQGLIVDMVSDIVTIPADQLQPAPTVGQDDIVHFLEGIAAIEDKMVMILSLQSLVSDYSSLEAA